MRKENKIETTKTCKTCKYIEINGNEYRCKLLNKYYWDDVFKNSSCKYWKERKMLRKTLIEDIIELNNKFIAKTSVSYLSDFRGWKRKEMSYLFLIKGKLELLLARFK